MNDSTIPSDLGEIFRQEQRYLGAGNREQALIFLVKCLFYGSIQPAVRGILSSHIILNYLAPHTSEFSHRFVEDLNIDATPFTSKLYRGLDELLQEFTTRINLIRRFQVPDGWTVGNSPHFVIELPKSNGSNFKNCLASAMTLHNNGNLDNEPFGRSSHPRWWNMGKLDANAVGMVQDFDFRPESGMEGWGRFGISNLFFGHADPLGKNLAVLDMYPNSRYILLFREPKDFLVATYCSVLKYPDQSKYGPIFSFDGHAVNKEDVEGSLDYLINGGLLFNALLYVAKWLHFRDEQRSIVVTYEQFASEPIAALERAVSLLNLKVSLEQLHSVYDRHQTKFTQTRNDTVDTSYYPRGWTGRAGIWKDYFSEKNLADFNRVYRAFLGSVPFASKFESLYPSISSA